VPIKSTPAGRRTSLYAKLLGVGAIYGLAFTLIKSLFPTPVVLFFVGGPSSEGDLTVLASVYLASGLLAGVVGGPLFGTLLLLRNKGSGAGTPGSHATSTGGSDLWRSLVLSFLFAMLIGLISGLLIMGAYWFGILPPGGVLDPLALIRNANHPAGPPLLVIWTLARDLLPASLAGVFLAPFGGSFLYRLYVK
jgi:hypothetical protein